MALILADRVKESTTTTGTSDFALGGAVTGFQTFAAGVGVSNTTYYAVSQGSDWEVGLGTLSSDGLTLARTTVLQSSNSDTKVSFASGSKEIFVTYAADKAVFEDASGNVTLPANLTVTGGSTTDSVQLDLTAGVTPAVGQIAWDAAQGTASLGLLGGNVISRMGQSLVAYVTNAESVTITKGQAVYLFSAQGDRATVKLANNTGDSTSAKTLGIVAEDITANSTGFVVCQGVVYGLDLSAYTAGDTVYLGATAGTLTATKPYAPNHLVYMGVVEKANAGAGQIYVRVQNGYELDELHNVSAQSPSNGNTLVYNTSTSLWESTSTLSGSYTLSGGTANGVTYLNGSKVLTSGSALTFDGTNFNVIRSAATDQYINLYADATGPTIKFFGGAAGKLALLIADSASARMQFQNDGDKPFVYSINGSERMRLTSTGLGIGTSSPAYKLDISAPNDSTARVKLATTTGYNIFWSSNTGGGTFFGTEGSTGGVLSVGSAAYSSVITSLNANNPISFGINGTEKMRLDGSGNLGLGVTPSAWTIGKAFQVNGASVLSTGTEMYLSANAFYGASAWTYRQTDFAAQYYQLNGTHVWRTAPSGTAGNAISFTQAMTLDASGNLGVGTTSPYAKIHATGTIKVATGNAQGILALGEGNGSTVNCGIWRGAANAPTTDGNFLNLGGYDGIVFATGAAVIGSQTERARIDSSGNFTFKNGIIETVYALGTSGSLALNPTNGTIQTCALAGNPTFTDSLTEGQSMVLMLTNASSYTVTWPTILWVTSTGNTAPTLTAKSTLVFWKVGSSLYGAFVGSYV